MLASRTGLLGSLTLILLLAACGARSSLLPGEEGAGGTGAVGSAGAGADNSAGSGAGPVATGGSGGGFTGPCNTLIVDGPPRSPAPATAGNQVYLPWLARSEGDGARAALAYIENTKTPDLIYQAASVALDDPWGAWPDKLGPAGLHGLTEGFVINGHDDGRFAMLTTEEDCCGGGPVGMVAWAPVAGVSGAQGQFWNDVPPGRPMFVATDGGRYLAGSARFLDESLLHLTVSQVVFGQGPVSDSDTLACSLYVDPSGSAMARSGGGFLLALANGRPFGKCLTDDLADDQPTRFQIAAMQDKPGDAALTFEHVDPDSYVVQPLLVPAASGAWAAWERMPLGAPDPPYSRHIHLMQIDEGGSPLTGKIIEVGTGLAGMPFALAALGSRPVLGTTGFLSDGSIGVMVQLFNEDGTLLAEATFSPEAGFDVANSIALLGSPKGDRLLVAWGEDSAINNDDRTVRLARLTCAP